MSVDLRQHPNTPDGKEIVAPSFVYVEQSGMVQGQRCVCAADALNHFDWQIPVPIALQGVSAIIVDNTDGDYGELTVVDKDDVLGLFSVYGIPPGGELEIEKFGYTIYVPEGTWQISFVFASAFDIPPGIYIRLSWLSTHASIGPRIYPQYKLYKG